MANENLSKAKKAKNDEFYTQYPDIEKELNAYLEYNPQVFAGKTVLLPCDDPEWSNFTKYFAQNFTKLGLKKIVSTSYAPAAKTIPVQPSLFEVESPQYDPEKTEVRGKIFTLTHDITEDGNTNFHDIEWDYLEGDGDFRSEEVTRLRDEADVIVTNPPFSLFREFLGWVNPNEKRFVILGNKNAITYKEVFPYIQQNTLWAGATGFNKDLLFTSPEFIDITSLPSTAYRVIDGTIYLRAAAIWFTNLDHGKRHEPLSLMTEADNIKFSKHKQINGVGYKKYDNYDAIEVPFTNAIPSDYEGVMGVPISFLDKYNPDQFEILGATQRGCHDLVPDTRKYDDYWEVKPNGERTGSSGGKTNENANLEGNDGKKNYFTNSEGRVVQSTYQRIFVKHRKVT